MLCEEADYYLSRNLFLSLSFDTFWPFFRDERKNDFFCHKVGRENSEPHKWFDNLQSRTRKSWPFTLYSSKTPLLSHITWYGKFISYVDMSFPFHTSSEKNANFMHLKGLWFLKRFWCVSSIVFYPNRYQHLLQPHCWMYWNEWPV